MLPNHPRLELHQDEAFQNREWRLQRLAWVVWGVILVAALAGVLGPGPLSRTETTSPDGQVTVAYDRFVHYHHPEKLQVTLSTPDTSDEDLRLQLSQSLIDRVAIRRIEPEPVERQLVSDGAVYVFRREPGAQRTKIIFYLEFDKIGDGAGNLRLTGGDPVELRQFVYP